MQTVTPTAVIVNLPHQYPAHLGQIVATPEDWVARKKTRLVINRDCVDQGPATKLLGAQALIAMNPKALIIYLDDDHIPSAFFVKAHADAHRSSAKEPSVFCGRGEWLQTHPTFERKLVHSHMPSAVVQVASGVGSVSLLAKHLDIQGLAQFVNSVPRHALFSDDLLFSAWFEKRRLKIKTLGVRYLLKMMDHSIDDMALHKGQREDCSSNTSHRYASVVDELGLAFSSHIHPLSRKPSIASESDTHSSIAIAFENGEQPHPSRTVLLGRRKTGLRMPGPPGLCGGIRPCGIRPSRGVFRGRKNQG